MSCVCYDFTSVHVIAWCFDISVNFWLSIQLLTGTSIATVAERNKSAT